MWLDAAQTHTLPLGELLVGRGLITAAQLEQALAEQRECRRPLGEVIVRLGFATGTTIAQALATQHGGMLKSEYGYATGFDAVFASAEVGPPPVTVREGEKLTLVPPPQTQPAGAVEQLRDSRESKPAADPGALEQLAEAEERLDRLAEELAGAAHKIARAESERDTAVRAAAAHTDREQERSRLAARVAELERQLRERKTAHDDFSSSAQARIDELGRQLRQAEAERDAACDRLRCAEPADHVATAPELQNSQREQAGLATAAPSRAPADPTRHLLLFAAAGTRYLLIGRAGPPPPRGAHLDLSEYGGPRDAYVAKIAAAPTPGTTARCAYLI